MPDIVEKVLEQNSRGIFCRRLVHLSTNNSHTLCCSNNYFTKLAILREIPTFSTISPHCGHYPAKLQGLSGVLIAIAWPSFADQPYITNYRIYDDRVDETTRFTYRPDHEWYRFPQQKPTEVSMRKCYDSVTDGSVSRWSFHTACVDPTAPRDARCRKNVVVRSFVFF